MNENLTKNANEIMDSYYLKKIDGGDWYNSRFVQLCIILFFLVGFFSWLNIGGGWR